MFFQRQNDTAIDRQGTTGKSGSCTARCDSDMMVIAVDQNTADILFISGKEDGIRFKACTRCIIAVGDEVGFVAVDVFLPDDFFKGSDVFGVDHRIFFIS